MASRDYLTIGEVVRKLQPAYPELTVSKIRFLEDEGLIAPLRTAGGYRKFSLRDVERIESILRMQKLHFYPLSVIRAKLSALDRGEEVEEAVKDPQHSMGADLQVLEGQPQPIETVVDLLSIPVSFVRELDQFGLVEIRKGPAGPVVDGGAFGIIKSAWELSSYGIDPRHLRPFATAVDREAVMISQLVTPSLRSKNVDVKRQGEETLHELERLTEALKRDLLKQALSKQLDPS